MSIRAVIFDFGGVLVRTENRAPRTRLAARLGMTYDELSGLVFDSPSALQATKGEITTAEHWERIRESLGISPAEFDSIPADFWSGDVLDETLITYLRDLRSHYKTALLSNAWDDLRPALEQTWQIDDAFDHILISSEVGLVKPDVRIYEKLLTMLGVKPAEAVFVDDFPQNIEGARRVGLTTIQFHEKSQVLGELQILLGGK